VPDPKRAAPRWFTGGVSAVRGDHRGDRDADRPESAHTELQSVGIALDIIDALADAQESLSLSELARRVGVAKSTAHRTCAVLARRGLVDRTTGRGYRLGLRLVEYGHLATERTAVGEQALPLLVDLRNTLEETVQVGVPAGADVVYVERVEGQRALRYSTNSRRSPLHRSSAGKVLAAFNPELAEARLRAGLPPSTGYTIVVPDLLLAELATIRERGYARSVDETELGMSSLAVPVRDSEDGTVVAAISMVGPTPRVVEDHETHHIGILKAGAGRLTQAIAEGGYTVRRG
jgi:IclR family transcriptional regulator, KDG regulon repressor